jgi:hypothetical protein
VAEADDAHAFEHGTPFLLPAELLDRGLGGAIEEMQPARMQHEAHVLARLKPALGVDPADHHRAAADRKVSQELGAQLLGDVDPTAKPVRARAPRTRRPAADGSTRSSYVPQLAASRSRLARAVPRAALSSSALSRRTVRQIAAALKAMPGIEAARAATHDRVRAGI